MVLRSLGALFCVLPFMMLACVSSAAAQTSADEARARAQYEQGLRELYGGDAQAALDYAQSAQALLGADNPRLAALRVEAYMGLRDWEAAQDAYEEFFTLGPNAELSRHVANLTVIIDEAILNPPDASASPDAPDLAEPSAEPSGPLELASGFTPAPFTTEVRSGGTVRLRNIGRRGCAGWADTDPDLVLTFTAGASPRDLYVYIAGASGDMTMAIEPPQGRFLCNDDNDGLAPGIRIRDAISGQYRIWIGSYHGNERNATRHTGRLFISETGFGR